MFRIARRHCQFSQFAIGIAFLLLLTSCGGTSTEPLKGILFDYPNHLWLGQGGTLTLKIAQYAISRKSSDNQMLCLRPVPTRGLNFSALEACLTYSATVPLTLNLKFITTEAGRSETDIWLISRSVDPDGTSRDDALAVQPLKVTVTPFLGLTFQQAQLAILLSGGVILMLLALAQRLPK